MWVGRGATARPREAEWSSRLSAVFWVCYNKNILKIHRTTATSQAYYIVKIPEGPYNSLVRRRRVIDIGRRMSSLMSNRMARERPRRKHKLHDFGEKGFSWQRKHIVFHHQNHHFHPKITTSKRSCFLKSPSPPLISRLKSGNRRRRAVAIGEPRRPKAPLGAQANARLPRPHTSFVGCTPIQRIHQQYVAGESASPQPASWHDTKAGRWRTSRTQGTDNNSRSPHKCDITSAR